MDKEIENLDGQDTGILSRKGWHFITSYKSKQGGIGSDAHNNSLEKALAIDRPTGIRMIEEDELTTFEVWEFWK